MQSQRFVEEHSGRKDDIHIFGQEYTATTWRLCKMNLAIRGIDGNLGERDADTFSNDLHKMLKADYILANPPFNIKDWGANRLAGDVRWKYGMPPAGNANYAWIQHIISKLSPNGVAGFVMANGAMSTNTSSEAEIRKNIIEDKLVDCIISLPPNLFYNVTIPASLWFLKKNKKSSGRDRSNEILFIDARKMGTMVDRKHRELDFETEIKYIADIYHKWKKTIPQPVEIDNGLGMVAETRGVYEIGKLKEKDRYRDIKGFCKSVTLDEVRSHEYILTLGRYVGIEDKVDDGEPFDKKMTRLTGELAEMFAKRKSLEEEIRKRMGAIGYEF